MQVTQFTDFALRALLYLAVHRDRLVPVTEISAAYGISNHHLVKVANQLGRLGYLEATRGRGGGLKLSREPREITIGQVIRDTEPHLNLVECFDRAHNTCPIVGACALMRVLSEAQARFLAVLDAHRLSDLVEEPRAVARLLQIWSRVGGPPTRSQS